MDGAHPGRELRRGGGLADEPGHSGGERLLELTGTPVAGDDEHRGACTGGLLPQPPCGLHPVDPAELQVHDHHVGGVPGIPPVQQFLAGPERGEDVQVLLQPEQGGQ